MAAAWCIFKKQIGHRNEKLKARTSHIPNYKSTTVTEGYKKYILSYDKVLLYTVGQKVPWTSLTKESLLTKHGGDNEMAKGQFIK